VWIAPVRRGRMRFRQLVIVARPSTLRILPTISGIQTPRRFPVGLSTRPNEYETRASPKAVAPFATASPVRTSSSGGRPVFSVPDSAAIRSTFLPRRTSAEPPRRSSTPISAFSRGCYPRALARGRSRKPNLVTKSKSSRGRCTLGRFKFNRRRGFGARRKIATALTPTASFGGVVLPHRLGAGRIKSSSVRKPATKGLLPVKKMGFLSSIDSSLSQFAKSSLLFRLEPPFKLLMLRPDETFRWRSTTSRSQRLLLPETASLQNRVR